MIKVIFNQVVVCPFTTAKIQKWLDRISRKEPKIKGEVEISVVGGSVIKKINHKYRGKNKITDVLSFAWQDPAAASTKLWRGKETESLGEIYICYPQIKRQAKEYSVTAENEFKRMLVHGLLHLVGYDHIKKQDAVKMFKKQEKLILAIG